MGTHSKIKKVESLPKPTPDLTQMTDEGIYSLMESLGTPCWPTSTNIADLDGQGKMDLIVRERSADQTVQTFFLIDDGKSIQLKKYTEGEAITDGGDWDSKRAKKIGERIAALFPFAKSFSKPSFSNEPHEGPTLTAAPESSFWENTKHWVGDLMMPKELEKDTVIPQQELLAEMGAIADPRFLNTLLAIIHRDVRLGQPSLYDTSVIASADEALEKIVPNLGMEDLLTLDSSLTTRLRDVEEFWNDKNKNVTGQGKRLGDDDLQRIRGLLEQAKTRIQYLAKKSDPVPRTIVTHYIATNYRSAFDQIVTTPIQILTAPVALAERTNLVSFVPNAVAGIISGAFSAVVDLPGEAGGLVTGGAYGFFGSDLGSRISNTLLMAPLLLGLGAKGAKGLKVRNAALEANRLAAIERMAERAKAIKQEIKVEHPLANEVRASVSVAHDNSGVQINISVYNQNGGPRLFSVAVERTPGELYLWNINTEEAAGPAGKGTGLGTAVMVAFFRIAQKHFKTFTAGACVDGLLAWTHPRYGFKFGSVENGKVVPGGHNPWLKSEKSLISFFDDGRVRDVSAEVQKKFNTWRESAEGQAFLNSEEGVAYRQKMSDQGVSLDNIGNNPSMYPALFRSLFFSFDLVRDLVANPILDGEIKALEEHAAQKATGTTQKE